MCYDISYQITLETLEEYFEGLIIDDHQLDLNFDGAVHAQAQDFLPYPVILKHQLGYEARMFEWGIIPPEMGDPDTIKQWRPSMCNVRSERIYGDKQSAWYPLRHQRCLIPVTAIFEHRHIYDWGMAIPYLIRLKQRPLFCLPALYSFPMRPQRKEYKMPKGTFAPLTRGANPLMKKIHNAGENAGRMPLFLTRELEREWLDPNLSEQRMQAIMEFSMPSEELEYYSVYTIRGDTEHPMGGRKTDPYDWPGLPPLGNDRSQQALF